MFKFESESDAAGLLNGGNAIKICDLATLDTRNQSRSQGFWPQPEPFFSPKSRFQLWVSDTYRYLLQRSQEIMLKIKQC